MKNSRLPLWLGLLAAALPVLATAEPVVLFESIDNWTKASGKPAESSETGWELEDGVLHRAGGAGDLLSKSTYADFTLTFEWKIASGTNSGIKYRVADYDGSKLGPEYQIIDDGVHSDSKDPLRQAATVYALYPANAQKTLKPVGEWNTAKIVAKGTKIEHWLNGALVVSYDTSSDDFDTAVGKSKFKNVTGFAKNAGGHILIQDHGDEVWYRKMTVEIDD
jgi:hypothetical protein